MKKIFAIMASVLVAFASLSAQELSEVAELFNNGASTLAAGDKASALSIFEQALSQATALGDSGKEIVENCQKAIPSTQLEWGKDFARNSDFDGAIEKVKAAITSAKQYSIQDVLDDATELLPQLLINKGNGLLSAKNYAAAADAYKEAQGLNPSDGMASLRLGMALNGAGDLAGAKEALTKAIENGQAEAANKQLSSIGLKSAAAALKAKNFAGAVTEALESCKYVENAQAYQVAAQASQLSGKDSDAIKYFEKYLELAPSAKNATQIAYTLGALYQKAKNNTKAKEYYTKAVNDPKFGAAAKKLLDALK